MGKSRTLAQRSRAKSPAAIRNKTPASGELSPAQLRAATLEMARLRRLDERLIALQRQGRLGFHGSALGEEACVIGCAFALRKTDWVFSALRQGAIMLHRGYPLRDYLAQSFGCSLDATHGRQMPAHFASRQVDQVSWGSCIGTQIPQSVGAAFAARQLGHDVVVAGFMGDGATSEADFHCAMTFAGVWKVPVVLICQNNQWAISEPLERQTLVTQLYRKAEAYGLPGVRANGQDVREVYRVVHSAVEKARAGGGPTFVELLTARIGAHSTSDDPNVYRDEKALQAWFAKNDPIDIGLAACGEELTKEAVVAELQAFDRELESVIGELERAAPPDIETLTQDVYADLPWHLREQQPHTRQPKTH